MNLSCKAILLLLAPPICLAQYPCVLVVSLDPNGPAGATKTQCAQPGSGLSMSQDLLFLNMNIWASSDFQKYSDSISGALAKLQGGNVASQAPAQFTADQVSLITNWLALLNDGACTVAYQSFRTANAVSTSPRHWTATLQEAIPSRINVSNVVVVYRNGDPQQPGYDVNVTATLDRMALIVTDATSQNLTNGTAWSPADKVTLVWIQ